jgi:hypothetical protein
MNEKKKNPGHLFHVIDKQLPLTYAHFVKPKTIELISLNIQDFINAKLVGSKLKS